VSEPSPTGVKAVASLPDRIEQAIDSVTFDAELAVRDEPPSSLSYRLARQVLRAADIDRAELARKALLGQADDGRWHASIHLMAKRYGVSLDA
jgi:hypothetical protein